MFFSRLNLSVFYISSIIIGNKDGHIESYISHCVDCFSNILRDQDYSKINPDNMEKTLHLEAIAFAYFASLTYDWFPRTRDRIRHGIYLSCKRKAIWCAKNVK